MKAAVLGRELSRRLLARELKQEFRPKVCEMHSRGVLTWRKQAFQCSKSDT